MKGKIDPEQDKQAAIHFLESAERTFAAMDEAKRPLKANTGVFGISKTGYSYWPSPHWLYTPQREDVEE